MPQALTYLVDDVVPAVRHDPGRRRRVVPAQRRRGGADRAGAPPARRPRCGCAGSRRPWWSATCRSTCCCPGCASSAPPRSSRPPDGTVRLARREVLRARTPRRHRPGRRWPCRGRSTHGAPGSRPGSPRPSPRSGPATGPPRTGPRPACARPSRPRRPRRWPCCGRRSRPAAAVWIGYVDNHGSTVERVVDPVKVEARLAVGLRPPHRGRAVLRGAPDHRRTPHRRLSGENLTFRRRSTAHNWSPAPLRGDERGARSAGGEGT